MTNIVNLFMLLLVLAGCDPATKETPKPPEKVATPVPTPPVPPPAQAAPAAPKVDCEALVGQADASRIIGHTLVPVDLAKVGPRRCRFGVSADATTGAQLDAIYLCGPAALPMYRNIDQEIASGGKAVAVGKKAVLLRKEDRGIVQFLDDDSPCAAEVVAVPADKAVDAARMVSGKLKSPVL